MSMKLADIDSTQLRFPVGTRVECNCGQWKAGTVVKHFYTQSSFPEGMCVPYQVKLDDGKLIFAPKDVDGVVRLLVGQENLANVAPPRYRQPAVLFIGQCGSADWPQPAEPSGEVTRGFDPGRPIGGTSWGTGVVEMSGKRAQPLEVSR